MTMRVEHVEYSLKDVLGYFVEGFKFEGEKVYRYETFIDPFTHKVMFKLILEEVPAEEKPKKKNPYDLSPQELDQVLRNAGIIDENGEVDEMYRPE